MIVLTFFVSRVNAETIESTEPIIVASGTTGNADWSLDSEGTLTIFGKGTMGTYDQQTTYAPWHEYGEQVKKIIIQDGVTSIGNFAFYDCVNATDIEFGNTVVKIGRYAFNGSFLCFEIPASVTSIDQYAFNYSQGKLLEYKVHQDNLYYSSDEKGVLFDKNKEVLLRAPDCLEGSYTVPESVLKIQIGFMDCTKLIDLVISDNVKSLDSSALRRCISLQSLTIGDGVTEFGNLFVSSTGLENLTTITIGKGLNSFGAISRLKVLKEINISQENDTFLSVNGVVYNKEMTELVAFPCGIEGSFQVPDGIIRISMSAFYGSVLSEIVLPDSVEKLGCFTHCTRLRKFTVPNNVDTIPQGCFNGCSNLKEVSLPESLTDIDQYAFKDCLSLTEINFPVDLYSIERGAFEGCAGLAKITFTGGFPGYIDSIAFSGVTACCYYPENILTWTDDVKIDYGGTLTWVFYEVNQFEGLDLVFTVPDTDITLAYKIDEEKNIASIILCSSDATGDLEIPEIIEGYTVTDIGDSAFKECVGLTGITIPDTVSKIGCHAFDGCTKLEKINIPDSITVIEEYSFANCGLLSVALPESVVEICSNAFSNTKMSEITIPDSVSIIGAGAFSENSKLVEVFLPNSLMYIADNMFQNCRNLLNVRLPEKLITIGDEAFSGCLCLNSMVLPEGLEIIGRRAFVMCGAYDLYKWDYPCNKFTSITLPDTLKYIGIDAFGLCQSLQNIEIPDSVTRIEEYTFRSCYRLESVSVPSSCEYIGENAFQQCKKLSSVTFRWNAPEIDTNAFNSTTTTCYYPGNNEEWTSDLLQNYGGSLTWVAQEMEKPSVGAGGGDGENPGEAEGSESEETGSGNGEGDSEKEESESGENNGNGSDNSGDTGNSGESSGDTGNSGESSGDTGGESGNINVTMNGTSALNAGAVILEPTGGWTEGTNTFIVDCDIPCVVAASYDKGNTYTYLNSMKVQDGYSFTVNSVTAETIIAIVVLGDVNGDGSITNADITKLSAAFAGKVDLNSLQLLAADVNKSGDISNADITKLCAEYAQKIEFTW